MKQKLFALLLSAAMIFALTACGADNFMEVIAVTVTNSDAEGIIGGSDGPTEIIVATPEDGSESDETDPGTTDGSGDSLYEELPSIDEYGTYNYCNKEFNALFDKASVTLDVKERKDLLFEMEKILVTDPATILLGWNRNYVVTKAGLTGLLISSGDSDYTYMDLAQ